MKGAKGALRKDNRPGILSQGIPQIYAWVSLRKDNREPINASIVNS